MNRSTRLFAAVTTALGLLVMVGAPADAHADEPPPAPNAPLAQPPVAPSSVADKTAVLTGDILASARGTAPVFGMDLLVGQQMGIRPSVAVYATEKSSFLVEGFYGALLTKFGSSEGAGGGVRWVTTRGGRDAVTLGPGVDVLFNTNHGKATFLAPTIDISWRHSFGERAAFQLGMNAGIGIGISGTRSHNENVGGEITPLISLYSGLRY